MLSRSLIIVSLLGVSSVAVAGVFTQSAFAQSSQYQYLSVNSMVGNDTSEGSDRAPLRTITRALQIAQPNTIILLAPGTYSPETGEVFPLQMRPNTTIKGDPSNRGQRVIIRGGGAFLSRTFARQNVAIVGANQAGLTGVTVSNPNPQGYGLWVESSSPVISDNTFLNSNHDGASIVGNSAPILRNNYFNQNGANGITIYGTSRPEIQENIFENTGFGINIAQNSAPRIIGNRITQNKDGVVVQNNAQPILRGNVIDENSRDGLVAIAQSQPDLGTTTDPGNNSFLNNGQFDINAAKSIQQISASGNQVAATKSIGKLDFYGRSAVNSSRSNNVSFGQTSPSNNYPTSLASGYTPTYPKINPVGTPSNYRPTYPQNNALPAVRPTANAPVTIAVGQPERGRVLPQPAQPNFNVLRPVGNAIPISVPQPENRAVASRPIMSMPQGVIPAPRGFGGRAVINTTPQPPRQAATRSSVLPVPSAKIPVGRVGSSAPRVWRGGSAPKRPAAIASRPNSSGPRFRVIVTSVTDDQQNQLRSVVPGAFLLRSGLMQAGVFDERGKADELLQFLMQQGIYAAVEQF
jgi:parallel beta-helix repeat protein